MLLATVITSVIFVPTQTSAQASISIDHVDGLILGKVQPDTPIKFHIRYTNNMSFNIDGLTNGFRIYLRNNGELANGMYEPPYFTDLLSEIPQMFDLIFGLYDFADGLSVFGGEGSDTVGILGSRLSNTGLPIGYDKVIMKLNTSVLSAYAGDSLCIDSSMHAPQRPWLWASGIAGNVIPDWSGPHCYEIMPSCCVGMRGNFNNSSDDQIDISDLVFLVNYMFFMGTAPLCLDEADFTGDGNIDIADLIALVEYMHFGGAPPANCQ